MALYLIGDVQGCDEPLQRLLETVDFSPSRDTLYMLGDLVNRGPASLGVMRRLSALGDAAQCLLGNHDLHMLALAKGVRQPSRKDTVQDALKAPDAAALIDWLQHRAMAIKAHGWLMVHAGVLPQWSAKQTMALAKEVECALRGSDVAFFLGAMYANTPTQWHDALQGAERLRVVVNALTRLRFCSADGAMEFTSSDTASNPPVGYMPWFSVPSRLTTAIPIAFGHWSTLASGATDANTTNGLRHNTLALDTGCVWGGCLTAARLGVIPGSFELTQVKCAQALKPKQAKPSQAK